MKIDIIENLRTANTTCVVIPTKEYAETSLDLIRQLTQKYPKTLYVTLNKLYAPLKRKLVDGGVDISKIVFIDCVTKTAIANPVDTDECMYVSSPHAMTEISISITKMIQTHDPDCIFFDSISTLLIYEENMVVNQFIHSLTNKITAFGRRLVLTALDGEKERELIKQLGMIVERVIEPEK